MMEISCFALQDLKDTFSQNRSRLMGVPNFIAGTLKE